MQEQYKAFPFGDDGQFMVQRGTDPYVALFNGPAGGKTAQQRAEHYAACINGEPGYADGTTGPPDGPP